MPKILPPIPANRSYQLLESGAVQRDDGAIIPTDPRNRDHIAYVAWVQAGNTAKPVVAATKPTSIPAGEFLQRFTPAEQLAIQTAALTNAQLFLGLIQGLASGNITLTDPLVNAWLEGLVGVKALTEARKTAVLTP